MREQTRVTNSQAAANQSWMVRCSPCAPGFSQSNPIISDNKLPLLTDNNFQIPPLLFGPPPPPFNHYYLELESNQTALHQTLSLESPLLSYFGVHNDHLLAGAGWWS